ncbi:MAG: hypothetical protein Tsb0034_03480 [Ekhidna sp.]
MKRDRSLGILILLLVGVSASTAQNQAVTNYHKVEIKASFISIHGETNVNKFNCEVNKPSLNDSIVVKNIWSNQKLEFQGLKLIYKVGDFKCGIRAMEPDFRELLKAEEEPFVVLQLNAITLHPNNDAFERLDVEADVDIFIAGVRRQIVVQHGQVINHSSAHMTFKGDKQLLMTDFDIEPPAKFLGMVKVANDIRVEFAIEMVVSAL